MRLGRKTLRFLGSLLLLAAAGAVFVWIVRPSSQRSELEELLAKQAAEGLGASADDAFASLSPVDAALQERAWRWLASARETDVAGLRALLAEPGLVLSSLGWLAADRQRLTAGRFVERQPRMAHWGLLLPLAERLAKEAETAEDPASSLDALDALVRALSHGPALFDHMVCSALQEVRDKAYLSSSLRGRVPTDRIAAWARAEELPPARLADAVRHERLVFMLPWAEAIVDGRFRVEDFGSNPSPFRDFGKWFEHRIVGPTRWAKDCAVVLEESAAFERWLRGSASPEDLARLLAEPPPSVGWPFEMLRPDPRRFTFHWLLNRARRRSYRAAALPSDEDLLREGPFDLRLLRDRATDGVLRVRVDPESPLPALLEREQLAAVAAKDQNAVEARIR